MRLHRTTFRAMASAHELQLACDDEALARRAAAAAVADVLRIEAKFSRYRDDSVVARINRAAGAAAVAIDPETAALLHYADACHRASGGAFDVTSGVLRRAWDFRAAVPRLPDERTLAAAVALVGWHEVEWDDASIRLPRAGMEIDFGGIGKEYAADRAATICIEHGIAHGLVNLGGDVRAFGGQPDGSPWRVGVRDPRREGEAIAAVEVVDGAVATSGDYERYFEIAGRRYCHVLDPRTGWPVTAWRSVSVAAPLAVVAGTHATVAMLLGPAAPEYLAAQGFAWLGIAADGSPAGTLAGTLAACQSGATAVPGQCHTGVGTGPDPGSTPVRRG